MTTRERILRAAAGLLAAGGRDAVSTRAVSAAAGVQAPTLYRLFGDKDGLLDAVAAYGFAEYLARKKELGETDDPVDDLRRGWDLHVEFGLSQPASYCLMYGTGREPSDAGRAAAEILHRLVSRIAEAGLLRMSVRRATQLAHATGVGVTLTLIATPETDRDLAVSRIARETVLAAITTGEPHHAPADLPSRAVALRAALPPVGAPLTGAEHALLVEWLDRLADET